MKRVITFLLSTAMALGVFAGTAVAGGHEWDHETPHAHVMLIGVEVVDATANTTTISFRNCVDLEANGPNDALPTPAHHHSVHTGQTGKAGGSPMVQGPLYQAGNWVLPMYPYLPLEFLTGCEALTSPATLPFGM